MLEIYRAHHVFRYPGCLCPQAAGAENETILFLATYGEYEGRLVFACARNACGYIGMYADDSPY